MVREPIGKHAAFSLLTEMTSRSGAYKVFNEPDPARRAAVIAENYAEDVVWHESDRIIRGRKDLERRAGELRAEHPDWAFRPVGPASGLDDIGHLDRPAGRPRGR